MNTVVRVSLQDGLMLPSGHVAASTYACVIFCRVPDDWAAEGVLKDEHHEAVLEYLYGKTFRNGNEDGSRYVYRGFQTHVLTAEEVAAAPWRGMTNNNEFHYWHCRATASSELRRETPEEF